MRFPVEVTPRPWWQHPFTVISVSIGLILVVMVAFSLDDGSSSDNDESSALESPTAVPTPTVEDPDAEDEADLVAPPPAAPPVLLIEPTRPERLDLWNTAIDFVEASRTGDVRAVAELTWSGCSAAGTSIAAEFSSRYEPFGLSPSYRFDAVLVISENLGVAEVVMGPREDKERLIFVRENEVWRSGLCSVAADDLSHEIELPEDLSALVALAGLDYQDESLSEQPFQTRDLAYANFDGADLSLSNMAGSVFESATFRGANLSDAWIAGATTSDAGADFSGARLLATFFTDADLTGSRFDGADATDANFTGATLTDVSFRNTNLTGAFIDAGSARSVIDWTGATCPDGEPSEELTGCLGHLNPYG